jgi:hypothetical protein
MLLATIAGAPRAAGDDDADDGAEATGARAAHETSVTATASVSPRGGATPQS